jgi:hypothetical protein
MNLNRLADGLRSQGLTVERGDEASQPFFSVSGRMLKVGGEDVQVFEYLNAEVAAAEAKRVGMNKAMWVATPHFYRSGRIIVLYVGENPTLLKALEFVLGSQLAVAR